MIEFIHEAGYGIFPVIFFGIFGLVVSVRHASSPARERVPLVIGLALATILMGVLGAVVGVQTTARALMSEVPMRIFVFGLRESLNNMVAAFLFATIHALIGTYGTHKLVKNELLQARASS
jgi:hypothetical protein